MGEDVGMWVVVCVGVGRGACGELGHVSGGCVGCGVWEWLGYVGVGL